MMQRKNTQELYVHPTQGDDNASGSSIAPFKTLTRALQQAKAGVMIQLSRGVYSAESGEQFPLVIRGDVMVVGNLPTQGKGVVIQGSGTYQSQEFGFQSVTLVLQDTAEIQGVTVTNPTPKGSGVWIEVDRPLMSACTLSQSGREGVFVTGEADPVISSCLFEHNGASGLALVRDARSEVRSNIFRQNGFGLVISDRAAPIVSNNQFQENRSGLVISGMASPVLRGNIFSQNQEDGLAVLGQATPDLGQRYDPAGNRFRDNQRFDLRHATPHSLLAVGNQLNPTRISGSVALQSTGTPSPASQFEAPSPASAARSPSSHHWATPLIQPLLDRRLLPGGPEGFAPQEPLTAAVWRSWLGNVGLDLADADLGLAVAAQPLTRLQVIVSLVKALNLPLAHPAILRPYRDRTQLPSGTTLAVATALRHRLILSPAPDRLLPLQDASQGEAAAMLYQALALQQQVATVDLPQILRVPPPLITPLRRTQPPVVVIDPGHGGTDSGVVTEPEVAEDNAPAAPVPLLNRNEMMMSPLPAGNLNDFPDMVEFGLPAQSPLLPPVVAPISPQIPSQGMEPPPGMPVEPNRDPDAPDELPSLEEKTVNLAVAEAVANFLRQQGVQVVLTRSGDETRSLTERVAVAAEQKADLFVSLHANASLTQQPSLNGVETYHNPSSAEGRQLAWAIHKSLTRSSDVVDRGVHCATFLTLRQPWPAVHLEVGYITGSQDAPSLANLAYHRFLGRSIASGIMRYVRQQEVQR